jgi:hypothetical protein
MHDLNINMTNFIIIYIFNPIIFDHPYNHMKLSLILLDAELNWQSIYLKQNMHKTWNI